MKLKLKVLKRIISVLCAMSMATSFVTTSAGAIGTNNAEAAFSMKYMDYLPKPGGDNFNEFSGKYERNEIAGKKYTDMLQENRTYNVKYPINNYTNFRTATEEINEKEVYADIQKVVDDLKQKVKNRTLISKHCKMPEEMRLAKAIYRWVAIKIPYDHDSSKKINGVSLRKPQDPLYVFSKKTGICVGKANLANLMMRMAGIPSAVIASRTHAFNAVYLKDTANNREGWTLIDSTWAAPGSDMERQVGKPDEVKTKEDILKMSRDWFVNSGFKEPNKMFVERINTINRLHNHESLKYSKEYTDKFYALCNEVFGKCKEAYKEAYKKAYKDNLDMLEFFDDQLEFFDDQLEFFDDQDDQQEIQTIVADMNQKIKAGIDELNKQYNNIAKFKSFEIKFLSHNMNKAPEKTLAVDVEVDFPVQDAEKVLEKFKYWSDDMKGFFPAFYDKALSFKNANEDIIDKRSHKFQQIVFGNWFDETALNSVFDLNINGVKYEVSGGQEGRSREFKLTGDLNNPLENVVISSDLVGLGLRFRIGSGIKSLILKDDERIYFDDSENLERLDITESKNYIFKDGQLYRRDKTGSPNIKVNFSNRIKIIDDKGAVEKARKEKEEKLKEEASSAKKMFMEEQTEFINWRNEKNVNVDPKVMEKIEAVNKLSMGLDKPFNIENAEQFIKEANEAIEMMKKVRIDHEKERVGKIFKKEHHEFRDWKNKEKVDVDPEVMAKRKAVIKLFIELDKLFDIEKAKLFIKKAQEAIEMMDKVKTDYEKEKLKEKLEKEFSSAKKMFIKEETEFRKWIDKENVNVNSKVMEKIKAVILLSWRLSKQFDIENAKQFIKEAQEAIEMIDKVKTDHENIIRDVNLKLISSLNRDIQETEEEKNKCVEEFDSKIENMRKEILHLEALIQGSVESGVGDVQINKLFEQKQKELSDLQTQKSNRVAEYDKEIEENNYRVKVLNSELNELFN